MSLHCDGILMNLTGNSVSVGIQSGSRLPASLAFVARTLAERRETPREFLNLLI
jgi:hypothetical protein